MTDAQFLKACPFCGGHAEFDIEPEQWGYQNECGAVVCRSCGSQSKTLFSTKPHGSSPTNTKELLAVAWNSRVAAEIP